MFRKIGRIYLCIIFIGATFVLKSPGASFILPGCHHDRTNETYFYTYYIYSLDAADDVIVGNQCAGAQFP